MCATQSERRKLAVMADKAKLLEDFAAIKDALGEMFPSIEESQLNQIVASGCADEARGTVRERYLASLKRARDILKAGNLAD